MISLLSVSQSPHIITVIRMCSVAYVTVSECPYMAADDYCLHSQVDLCLFCMNICTIMTLYGNKVLEFCELGFESYWKLGIHCLGLPGCNAYTSKIPQAATLPLERKKQPALGLNDDHRSTSH